MNAPLVAPPPPVLALTLATTAFARPAEQKDAEDAAEKKKYKHEQALQEVERRREARLAAKNEDKDEEAIKRCGRLRASVPLRLCAHTPPPARMWLARTGAARLNALGYSHSCEEHACARGSM